MRLIRNKEVADSIRSYWGGIKTMEDISSRLEELRIKAADIQVQIFHNKYITTFRPAASSTFRYFSFTGSKTYQ